VDIAPCAPVLPPVTPSSLAQSAGCETGRAPLSIEMGR